MNGRASLMRKNQTGSVAIISCPRYSRRGPSWDWNHHRKYAISIEINRHEIWWKHSFMCWNYLSDWISLVEQLLKSFQALLFERLIVHNIGSFQIRWIAQSLDIWQSCIKSRNQRKSTYDWLRVLYRVWIRFRLQWLWIRVAATPLKLNFEGRETTPFNEIDSLTDLCYYKQ